MTNVELMKLHFIVLASYTSTLVLNISNNPRFNVITKHDMKSIFKLWHIFRTITTDTPVSHHETLPNHQMRPSLPSLNDHPPV